MLPVTPIDEWRERAQCIGKTSLFFPPEGERPQKQLKRERLEKDLCEICLVTSQCLEYGNANIEHGIWGGLNEVERGVKPYASTNYRQFSKRS